MIKGSWAGALDHWVTNQCGMPYRVETPRLGQDIQHHAFLYQVKPFTTKSHPLSDEGHHSFF